MPGLIGIASNKKVNEHLVHQMVNSIKHEEWYKVDKYTNSYFGIARVHLGIFNPEPQPIFNEDKSFCIFMDGKIYDYEEKMNELKRKGYKFNIGNDPEFCLHLYEELGEDFVKKLNGSFIIVICDFKEKKLLIVNDRYGLRPHYYAVNNGKLLFASEVKAILQDKTFKKYLNDETIADFFAFGEILGNKTFFKGIEVLPPASIFMYKNGEISMKQYWDFNYQPDYSKSEEEFVDELVKTFKKALEIRMKDDYRYGVSLSGGLDSRVVVSAIDEDKRKDILSFTLGPLDCDEVKIAKKVSNKAGTKHKILEINPEMIIDNAEKEIFYSDGMDYIGVSFIPPIHRLIKSDIEVAFTGLTLDTTVSNPWLTKEILNTKTDEELFNILFKKWRFFSNEELNKLFVNKYYTKIKTYPLSSFKEAFDRVKEIHPGNKSDHFELQNHTRRWALMGHVLMRIAVEYSIPALDNEFIDIALTIPPELRLHYRIYRKFLKKLSPELAKIPYNKTKIQADAPIILWKVGEKYLRLNNKIKRLIWRVSKGKIFIHSKRSYVEFNEWLRTNEEWKNYFKELLLNDNAISREYFNQDFIRELFREHAEGKRNNAMKILYLASFELFLKLFVNNNSNNSHD